MIGNVLDVKGHRTLGGALWFYFLALTLLVGISTTLVHFLGMVGVVDGGGTFFGGGDTFTLIGTIFTILVGGMILNGRGLTSDLYSVLLVGVGIYLAYTSSVMLGLIPLALITTMKR